MFLIREKMTLIKNITMNYSTHMISYHEYVKLQFIYVPFCLNGHFFGGVDWIDVCPIPLKVHMLKCKSPIGNGEFRRF